MGLGHALGGRSLRIPEQLEQIAEAHLLGVPDYPPPASRMAGSAGADLVRSGIRRMAGRPITNRRAHDHRAGARNPFSAPQKTAQPNRTSLLIGVPVQLQADPSTMMGGFRGDRAGPPRQGFFGPWGRSSFGLAGR